jgi:FkbM family methyltransferase
MKHIAFCFQTTRNGSYLRTLKVASAYLGLHLRLFKGRKRTLEVQFDDFAMDLNIYSREVAGYWEIFQEQQYLDVAPTDKDQQVVVLDIGANVGFFAVRQALRHGKNLRLIAFEPDPETYGRLQANVGRIRRSVESDITCYNCALDTHTGQAKFLQDMSVESRILEDDSTAPAITVQITTLDSIIEKEGIEKIDLLKLDVEGHELKVLAGGSKALGITDNITLEYHHPDFVEAIGKLLAPYSFHLVNHNQDKAILSFAKKLSPASQALANQVPVSRLHEMTKTATT